jgi:hypothetical protein
MEIDDSKTPERSFSASVCDPWWSSERATRVVGRWCRNIELVILAELWNL